MESRRWTVGGKHVLGGGIGVWFDKATGHFDGASVGFGPGAGADLSRINFTATHTFQ